MTKKTRTLDQIATAKQRAVTFLRNVLENDDRADEVEEESLRDYAERKGIRIIENPSSRTKGTGMATKKDLEELLDQVSTLAFDALTPQTTRKEAIDALQEINDLVGLNDEDPEVDDDDEEDPED